MDLRLRQAERAALSGDPDAQARFDRALCRSRGHFWEPLTLKHATYFFFSEGIFYCATCAVCGERKKRERALGESVFAANYAAIETRIFHYYGHSDVRWTQACLRRFRWDKCFYRAPRIREYVEPEEVCYLPRSWHPTKKRAWKKSNYRKLVKQRRKAKRH